MNNKDRSVSVPKNVQTLCDVITSSMSVDDFVRIFLLEAEHQSEKSKPRICFAIFKNQSNICIKRVLILVQLGKGWGLSTPGDLCAWVLCPLIN